MHALHHPDHAELSSKIHSFASRLILSAICRWFKHHEVRMQAVAAEAGCLQAHTAAMQELAEPAGPQVMPGQPIERVSESL